MKHLLFFVVLSLAGNTLFAQTEKNSVVKIDEAQKSGKLSESDAIKLKLKMLRGEPLPSDYVSSTPVKCGFGAAVEIHSYQKTHPNENFRIAKTVSQTIYNYSFVSHAQTKLFRINYDTTGVDAVPALDTNGNGIRDWVEETGKAFEKAYRTEVDTLGYREPIGFSINGYFEVFIETMPDYGYTVPLNPNPSDPNAYTSEIHVNSNYGSGFYTHGYDALRVTCAHEFHHAIQLSYVYTYGTEGWYYEITSTWMEDVVYTEVNDYYAYLPVFFNQADQSLNTFNGSHEYGACVWNHFIAKHYGNNVIRKSWENMPTRNAVNSINDALQSETGSDLSEASGEFSVWNYFTRARADSVNFYPEALYYPAIKLAVKTGLTDTVLSKTLTNLAANYYSFITGGYENYSLNFTSDVSANYFDIITVVTNAVSGKKNITHHPGGGRISVNNLVQGDTLTAIVANVQIPGIINGTYQYSLNLKANSTVGFYPNPLVLKEVPEINWRFRLLTDSEVRIDVYSISGKLVRRLDYGTVSAGSHDGAVESSLRWNGRDAGGNPLPSGVYIYKFTADGFKEMGKIAIVR